MTSTRVTRAIDPSAMIITQRRFQRSINAPAKGAKNTFGSKATKVAVAKMVDKTINEIVAEVVYDGDIFKYKIVNGHKEITDHEQELERDFDRERSGLP